MKHLKCVKTTPKPFSKWIKRFFIMFAVLGFLLILGTAGSSDLGHISLSETIMRSIIGLIMMAVGVLCQEVSNYGSRKEF